MNKTFLASVLIFGSLLLLSFNYQSQKVYKSEKLVYLEQVFNTDKECYATFKYPLLRGQKFKVNKITYNGGNKVEGFGFKYHGTTRWYHSGFFEDGLECS